MIWVELWLWSIALVGIRAFQQKNVIHDRYISIIPTSYVFSLCDIALMYRGLQTWEVSVFMTVLCVGTGAWMGCIASMVMHKKIHKM